MYAGQGRWRWRGGVGREGILNAVRSRLGTLEAEPTPDLEARFGAGGSLNLDTGFGSGSGLNNVR